MALITNARTIICVLALGAGAACGGDDDGAGDPDAGDDIDAGADIDAEPDPTPSVVGPILLAELEISGVPALGDGTFINIGLELVDDITAPSYDQMASSPFGCEAYEYTPSEYAAIVGSDQGEIQLTLDEGPAYPPCAYVPTQGYLCRGAAGSAGVIAEIAASTFTLTNDAAGFTADDVGRYVVITGSDVPQNNGRWPIVAADADSITYINQSPDAAAEDPTAATYFTLAGAGPALQDDPIPDDAALTVSLTSGGEGNVEDFELTVDDIGDDFTLTPASEELINDVPLDGSEFTITCDGEGGDCGVAQATIVNITTTDGNVSGLPPYIMPAPVTKAVVVRCVILSASATVNADASAFLETSGATRVRTSVFRVGSANENQDDAALSIAAGHGISGFTTILE